MAEDTLEATNTIRNADTANIIGTTAECLRECGKMGRGMAKEEFCYLMGLSKMEYGRTTRE